MPWKWTIQAFFDKMCLGFRLHYMWRIMRANQLIFIESGVYRFLQINSSYIYTVYNFCRNIYIFHELKGIVHPKMKILSSFTHPQVVPNLYECLCSAEHKGRYSEECGKQSSSGAPLTSIVFFSYYGSQWCPKTAWLQTFFKISSFVFGRTKTFIQVWNYLRVSKWWQNFHFWVNYPFKFSLQNTFVTKRFTIKLNTNIWTTLLNVMKIQINVLENLLKYFFFFKNKIKQYKL